MGIYFGLAFMNNPVYAGEGGSGSYHTGNFREINVTDCYDLNNGTMWTPAYDGMTFRFGATDTSAVYWRVNLPVVDDDNAFFRLKGEYPHAVYFSYHVNGEDTRYIIHITDYEIIPDPGSENHFAAGNDKVEIGGFDKGNYYTIDIIDSKDQIKKDNVVYGGYVNGEERVRHNVMMYRIYEPFRNDDGRYADIDLPQLYYVTEIRDMFRPSLIRPKRLPC